MTSKLDTLGGLLDADFKIYVCCETWNCNNIRMADLPALAAKYGRDHGAMHWDLVKLPWRCDRCDGRKVSFRLQPGGTQYASRRRPQDENDIPWE